MAFLRRDSVRLAKLGKGRKNKQVWRKPTGRHNKMRLRRKSYPAVVKIGRKMNAAKEAVIFIPHLEALQAVKDGATISLGRLGKKKKLAIVEAAQKKKLTIRGLNIKTFLKQNTPKKKEEPKHEPKK